MSGKLSIRWLVYVAFGLLIVVGLFAGVKLVGNREQITGEKVVIYKSPNCGCCVGYIAYLRNNGFDVEVVNVDDTSSLKEKHNIPHDLQSCHTVVIGNYFVEGHVPIEAVNKLLAEKPDIDGISLPGMPSGSPGMPGLKTEEFKIFSLKGGEASEFVTL